MIHVPMSPVGKLLITSFGLGLLRPAPGTWGSMPPVIVAGLLLILGAAPEEVAGAWWWGPGAWVTYHAVMVGIIILFSLACLIWGDIAEARFGKKDPGSVCADETAGMSIALLFIPAHAFSGPNAPWTLLTAFLAFRVFDILKLPPANKLQEHPGGMGILLDDLVAGVQALVVVQLVTWTIL